MMMSDRLVNNAKLIFAMALVVHCCLVQPASAQQQQGKSTSQAKQEGDPLLDDLLDLLDESEEKSTPSADSQKPDLAKPVANNQASAHPLQAIQFAMLTIADALRRGKADDDTVGLQQEVENQLDELIKQMEKSSNDSSESSKNDSKSKNSQSSENQESSSQTQQQQTGSQSQEEQGPQSGDSEADRPGEKGDQADGQVVLNQVTKLQQDVWGSLPKQVRQKMQSRMVESFLPEYRKQIEAYYRALLKEK